MAHAGQEIEGPGGFRLRLIETAAETGGALLRMEASYGDAGILPPEHLHPSQAEHFEVLEGAVRTIVGGVERRYDTGESFDVPPGTPHQMTGDVPARVLWDVRPALRTAEFFERLYAGLDAAAAGGEFDFAGFLDEFSAELRLTAT